MLAALGTTLKRVTAVSWKISYSVVGLPRGKIHRFFSRAVLVFLPFSFPWKKHGGKECEERKKFDDYSSRLDRV